MAKKGYWVASVDVNDPERYKQYLRENAPAFRKYGARFLVRGGDQEAVEGKLRGRIAVIEFKDYATAMACYRSTEYSAAKPHRTESALSDIVIIQGYDGRQPTD
ncbi:DUF1330 domain-containing protein [Inquilinus sp. CAU 1745]|uniref:DUF1330 domain-containing protein n=1 Tax=Inquilinus sp. CAU 1745 TaxID=3140369 RepID=UPI00325B3A9A